MMLCEMGVWPRYVCMEAQVGLLGGPGRSAGGGGGHS